MPYRNDRGRNQRELRRKQSYPRRTGALQNRTSLDRALLARVLRGFVRFTRFVHPVRVHLHERQGRRGHGNSGLAVADCGGCLRSVRLFAPQGNGNSSDEQAHRHKDWPPEPENF